jgi:hypothetical protein
MAAAAKQSAESSVMQPLLVAEPVSTISSRFKGMTFGTFGKEEKKPEYEPLENDEEQGSEAEEETRL